MGKSPLFPLTEYRSLLITIAYSFKNRNVAKCGDSSTCAFYSPINTEFQEQQFKQILPLK